MVRSSTADSQAPRRPTVVIGLIGASLDRGGRKRWERWRPTVDLCRHEDFIVDRLELLYKPGTRGHASVVDEVAADVAIISPETAVVRHAIELGDPWDFESVYAALLDFAAATASRTTRTT